MCLFKLPLEAYSVPIGHNLSGQMNFLLKSINYVLKSKVASIYYLFDPWHRKRRDARAHPASPIMELINSKNMRSHLSNNNSHINDTITVK